MLTIEVAIKRLGSRKNEWCKQWPQLILQRNHEAGKTNTFRYGEIRHTQDKWKSPEKNEAEAGEVKTLRKKRPLPLAVSAYAPRRCCIVYVQY